MRFLPLVLLVGGCAGQTSTAPSLLPRAIEARSDAEPVRPAAVATADAGLDAQIAERAAAFDAAAKAFVAIAADASARAAKAKGAVAGSDAWLDAQTALGDLGQARAASDTALAGLEELAIGRASAGAPPYPPLETAVASAKAELDRENAENSRLSGSLPL